MNLIIDIGNSRVKMALVNGDQVTHLDTRKSLGSDTLDKIIEKNGVTAYIISSTKEVSVELKQYIQADEKGYWLDHNTPLPFNNDYSTPETLGRDRIAAMAAVSELYSGQNVLVIDAGTCVTIDLLNQNNEYRGGSIHPGLNMRFKALNTFTGKLPLINQSDDQKFWGNSTESAIIAGVQEGMIQEITGLIALYEKEFPDLQVVITGGDANFLQKQLKNRIFAVPDLIVKGLNKILNFNVQ